MNVWYHLSTILSQRRVLQIAGLLTLCVAFITMLFFGIAANAAPGVNQTVSFQGRLLDSQGQPVPEGYYNIQFNLYEGGSGQEEGNPDGDLVWTETYVNDGGNNGVHIKNGYLSVDLGTLNPFGSQVDWNNDTIWLSMNIAGSSVLCETFGTAPCIDDGEMLPMKRLTASPYALNSGMLNGKTSDDLIHNGTAQQTGNFNINGTGIANILQGNTSVITPMIDGTAEGTLAIGQSQVATVNVGVADDKDQTINIGTGNANKSINIGTTSNYSLLTLQGGDGGVRIESGGGFAVQSADIGIDSLLVDGQGSVAVNLAQNRSFTVNSNDNGWLFDIKDDADTIRTGSQSLLEVNGYAHFNQGLTIQGSRTYTTPGGASLSTKI
ncbi:hypothetical protein B7Z17_03820, partial [Candidatus Saccharibacteria bacterium 32-49-10]